LNDGYFRKNSVNYCRGRRALSGLIFLEQKKTQNLLWERMPGNEKKTKNFKLKLPPKSSIDPKKLRRPPELFYLVEIRTKI
jgi:hypothetical protein